jgi:hypothetical protein
MSTSGQESVLYNFLGTPDGANPEAPLFAVHGTLYGTAIGGGIYPTLYGTVFKVSP